MYLALNLQKDFQPDPEVAQKWESYELIQLEDI
jgi:hypothetical protein